MPSHADKSTNSQHRVPANQPSPKIDVGEATFSSADNRPRAASSFVDNRPEAQQFARIQEMANNSPPAKKLAQLQAMINDSPRMVAQQEQIDRMFGKAVQRQEAPQEEELQMKAEVASAQLPSEDVPQKNSTGLPDDLKAGIENLSGVSLDNVNVHYNSAKPAQLQALAYTQDTDIHVGPGQEKHVPHEAWHVVQQRRGRVKPTLRAEGVPINDDTALEREADVMGAKALQMRRSEKRAFESPINDIQSYQQIKNDSPPIRESPELPKSLTTHTASKTSSVQMTTTVIQRSGLSSQLRNTFNQNGVAALFAAIDGAQVACAADADVGTLLTNILAGNELWLGQQHLLHGAVVGWPFHVSLEAHMKTGTGRAGAFQALRVDAAAHAVDVPTTNAIARMFQGQDLWYAQQLQGHGLEITWPLEIKIEKAARPGGVGNQEIYALLKHHDGAHAGNGAVTLAITAAFTAGSKELWYAQQLQAHGREPAWTNDLKAEKELRQVSGNTNWTNIMALLIAATQGEFDNVMINLPQTHNKKLITMLYAATAGDFDTFMGKMTRAQTLSFLQNVSVFNSLYYSAFLQRIKTSRMLQTTATWVGDLEWRGGSGPDAGANYQIGLDTGGGFNRHNHFAHWLRNGGPEPDQNSTMNCWEAVMFMAYRSGLIAKQWLVDLHTQAAQAGQDQASVQAYYNVLKGKLGVNSANAWTYSPVPPGNPNIPAGHLIFMNGLSHVLMSKGTRDGNERQEVYSMWIYPQMLPVGPLNAMTHGWMQDTTLEQIMITSGGIGNAVTFANPPW